MISYKARENDIVDSQSELQQSIINNLSVFFNSFVTKLQYEVKFVSSITTQDGTTQVGQTQTIQVGNYADGRAKMKTVVNKFAVIDIYITLPGQSRKKITRLALAPVNILNYKPSTQDLTIVSNAVGSILNGGSIPNIPTPSPTPTPTPTPSPTPTPTPTPSPTPTPTPTPSPTPTPTPTPAPTGDPSITNLSQYYASKGQSFPSITERSVIYENFGLGPKSTYVGTAEQNIALLAKLKAQTPTPSPTPTPKPTPAPEPHLYFTALGGTFDVFTKAGLDTYIYAISKGYTSPIAGAYPTITYKGVNFNVTDSVQRAALTALLP